MDEKEKLFGLVAIAQEQQKAVQVAIDTLNQQTAELKKAVADVRKSAGEGAEYGARATLLDASEKATEAFNNAARGTVARLEIVSNSADSAAQRLQKSANSFKAQWVLWPALSLVVCLLVFIVASWATVQYQRHQISTLAEQKNQLEIELASMEKKAGEWEAKAGKAVLSKCGEKGRLCVRIDTKAGGFVSDNGKHEYAVIYGY